MPMHDWTRVLPGIFHDFHNSWITHIKETLNGGLLPRDYYALGEQRAGDVSPDVLTLHARENDDSDDDATFYPEDSGGMLAVAVAPPQVRLSQQAEDVAFYLSRQRSLVIRHASGDRVVALIEIVSAANKHSESTLNDLVDKVVAALRDGIHVLIVDPQPPTRHDPNGVHELVREQIHAGHYKGPAESPLTLAAYCVTSPLTAYVEPFTVGDVLKDMPLFLTPKHYVSVPLEATYQAAWQGVPERWRNVINATTPPPRRPTA